MNDSIKQVSDVGNRRRQQGGPSLVLVGGMALGFFIGGLGISAALGGVLPSPFSSTAVVQGFFRDHPTAVQAGGIFLFASSARRSVAMDPLALSGLLQWSLSRPEGSADAAVVRAISTLAFLVGGPGHVVPLGLLVAGIAVPSLIIRLLPRPVAWGGLVIAVIAELSTLALVSPSLAILLPIARFPALIWL